MSILGRRSRRSRRIRRSRRSRRAKERESTILRPPDLAEADDPARAVHEWAAFWDADGQHVAATGQHLGTVMWDDDGAVGRRGWYY